MSQPLGSAELDHAARFLAETTGRPEPGLDSAALERVFRSLWGAGLPPADDPWWIDDLIRLRRVPEGQEIRPVICLTHDVDFVTSRDQALKLFRRLKHGLFGKGPASVGLKKTAGSLFRLLTEFPAREHRARH